MFKIKNTGDIYKMPVKFLRKDYAKSLDKGIPTALEIFIPNGMTLGDGCTVFQRYNSEPNIKNYYGYMAPYKFYLWYPDDSLEVKMQSNTSEYDTDEDICQGCRLFSRPDKRISCQFKFDAVVGDLISLDATVLTFDDTFGRMCMYTINLYDGILTLKYYDEQKTFNIRKTFNDSKTLTFAEAVSRPDYNIPLKYQPDKDNQVSFDVSEINLKQLLFMLNNYFDDPSIISDVIGGTNAYRKKRTFE